MTARTQERPRVAVQPVKARRAGKYLIFNLGKDEFGIEATAVREIVRVQDIAAEPGMPAHLWKVIHLRGKSIPVVDLRLRFAFAEAPFSETTCVIVVRVRQDSEPATIGFVVDGIAALLTLREGDIEDAQGFGEDLDGSFVSELHGGRQPLGSC